MRKIHLLVGSFITFALFGCTSLQDKELSSQKEVIRSFFIAGDNIYAIGQLNNYNFAGSKDHRTKDLIRILQSPYTKNISSVEIHSIAKDIEKNKVKAALTLYFNDKGFSQKQLDGLYGQEHLYNREHHKIYFGIKNGEIVEIENRNELLHKAKLTQPLETTYSEYRQERRYDSKKTDDNFEMADRVFAVSIVLIPLAIISLPFYAIQSLSEK